MIKQKSLAVIFASNPLFMQQRNRMAELAVKHRLPLVSSYREDVEAGGLMSYGLSLAENYRLAAAYVDKIFKGAKPADLPVEQPTRFELVLTMKTAEALGIKIRQSILVQATKVIE